MAAAGLVGGFFVTRRPLDPVSAVGFVDAITVKIREGQVANRPVYLALGVTVDGERDIQGLWAGEHGDGEGAKLSRQTLLAADEVEVWRKAHTRAPRCGGSG
jgi:transposase-like protein